MNQQPGGLGRSHVGIKNGSTPESQPSIRFRNAIMAWYRGTVKIVAGQQY